MHRQSRRRLSLMYFAAKTLGNIIIKDKREKMYPYTILSVVYLERKHAMAERVERMGFDDVRSYIQSPLVLHWYTRNSI